MKRPFPRMAFWKNDAPPKSELAARSREPISPPSRSAQVIDGTTNSGSAYAQNESGISAMSAYNRTQPYSYERPDSNPLDGVRPASGFAANDTSNGSGNLNSNGFGQSLAAPGNDYQNRAGNLGPSADYGQSFGASPAEAELPGRYPTQRASESVQSLSQTPTYPSTNFASFSPRASTASHESNLDATVNDEISQVSTSTPLNAPPTAKQLMPPSLPVSALNRQGSYAPGSTGSTAKPVNANGFNPNFGTPSAPQAGCPDGCSCEKCATPSAGGDFLPGGSFYGN